MVGRLSRLDIVVMVAVLALGSAFAQAPVYVSPTGNDGSGSGSAGAPFQTIGKALASAPAGGQVVLEPGVYEEAVAIDSGNQAVGSGVGTFVQVAAVPAGELSPSGLAWG